MRKGMVAIAAAALLVASTSWAAESTMKVKTKDGRTILAKIDDSKIVQMHASNLKRVAHYSLEEVKAIRAGKKTVAPLKTNAVDPTAEYWNLETYTGTNMSPGNATTYAGSCGTLTRTFLLADDTTFFDFSGTGAPAMNDLWFTTYAPAATQAGVLVLAANDSGGVPAGFTGVVWTFDNTFPIPAGFTVWNGGDVSGVAFTRPTSLNVWMGTGFDDRCGVSSTGTVTVTPAELNALGAGVFSGPEVGSSTSGSYFFGSAVPYGNPATGNVGSGPAGNLGFGSTFVPTPVMLQKFKAE